MVKEKHDKTRKKRKKSILDNPDYQESILAFCRACGRETYKRQNCWDDIVTKSTYFNYKKDNPEFVKKIEEACRVYSSLSKQANIKRYASLREHIQKIMETGEVEMRVTQEYTCKRDKDGKPLRDSSGMPVPDELVGTVKVQHILRPISMSAKIKLMEMFEKTVKEL